MPDCSDLAVGSDARSDGGGWVDLSRTVVLVLVEGSRDVTPVALPPAETTDLVVAPTLHPEGALTSLTPILTEEGYEPFSREDVIRAFQSELAGSASVAGIVLGPEGVVVGAQVSLVSTSAEFDPLASLRLNDVRPIVPFARTEARGRFRISGVAPGSYRLQAAAFGLAPAFSTTFRLRPGRVHDVGSLQLSQGARLIVRHSLGYVCLGERREIAIDLNGADGEVVGIGKGLIVLSHWNGGCVGGDPRSVSFPARGDVVVDFEKPEGGGRRDRLGR